MKKSFSRLLVMSCMLLIAPYITYAQNAGGGSENPDYKTIGGVVTDQQGTPLAGATVITKGSNKGAATDIKGTFSLRIPNSATTLVISFIGMESQSVAIANRTNFTIKLKPSSQSIDEIMVVGAYGGVQKKSEMVGSAYQVNASQLKSLPANRIDDVLKGLVPGLTIEANTDDAVSRTRNQIRIRGNTSLSAGREPMWIIDGVPMYTGDKTNQVSGMSYSVSPLSFIDMNDIESITVLKDATETTIYGANGSNGIILITTKSGKKGHKSLDVSLKYGVGVIDNSTKFKVLNSKQYMSLTKEAWRNAGNDMREFPLYDNDLNSYSTTNTDWYDMFYDVGKTVQANISMTGGSEHMSNYFSAGYFRDEPTIIGNTQDRISARLNSDFTISKRLTASVKLSTSYNVNNLFSPGRDYYEMRPIISPFYEDGKTYRLLNKDWTRMELVPGDIDPRTKLPVSENTSLMWPMETRFPNSIAEREQNDNRQKAMNIIAATTLTYKIIDGLSVSAYFGVDYLSTLEDMYDARTNHEGMTVVRATKEEDPERKLIFTPIGDATRSQATHMSWNNVERLNYAKSFGKHSVSGMALFEMTNNEYQHLQTTGSGFPNDKIKEVEYATTKKGTGNSKLTRSMSYAFQARYSYDERYFLTANYRSDGNSDFGEYTKWNNFASFGLSWNVHNEKFFKSDVVDKLKLRFSYGSVGNSKISGAISYGIYTTSNSNSDNNALGAIMTDMPNPGLSWETTLKTNIGIDIGLFKRLEVGLEYYNNMTKDLLSELYVSRIIGQGRVYRNVGRVRNRGIEVTLHSANIVSKNFTWDTDFNISHNKNKIVELYNGMPVSFGNTAWIEGKDMDAHMVIRWAGVDPRDGHPLWYDKNGNITRTYSYDNRVPYKTDRPTVYGSMTNTLRWKSFGLRFLLNYSIGGYVNSTFARMGITDGYDILKKNQAIETLDRWKRPGQLSPNPINMVANPLMTNAYSSRHLYSKTYVSLTNLAFDYTLPATFCSKLGMQRAKVTFIADNLGLWAPKDYPNYNSYKTIMNGYPSQRTFSVGLDISF